MIFVAVTDSEKVSIEVYEKSKNSPAGGSDRAGFAYSILPPAVCSRIDKYRKESDKKERIAAYLLLFHLLRYIKGNLNFSVSWNEQGKPFILSSCGNKEDKIEISISHSGGLCAVAVSDSTKACGVDIQEEISKERQQRLRERFYMGGDEEQIDDVVYLFCALDREGNGSFAEIPRHMFAPSSTAEDYISAWALGEAVLKCDGRGFGALAEQRDIKSKIKSRTVRLIYGGAGYALSVAKEK